MNSVVICGGSCWMIPIARCADRGIGELKPRLDLDEFVDPALARFSHSIHELPSSPANDIGNRITVNSTERVAFEVTAEVNAEDFVAQVSASSLARCDTGNRHQIELYKQEPEKETKPSRGTVRLRDAKNAQ